MDVKKAGNRICIRYSEPAFLYRGVGLAVENSHLDRFTLLETPRFSTNGLMLDCSRNAVASLPTLKTLIRQLALMGHNTLMLYTEDTYTVEGQPYFGYMRGRYTETELRELDEYASSFGIELVRASRRWPISNRPCSGTRIGTSGTLTTFCWPTMSAPMR